MSVIHSLRRGDGRTPRLRSRPEQTLERLKFCCEHFLLAKRKGRSGKGMEVDKTEVQTLSSVEDNLRGLRTALQSREKQILTIAIALTVRTDD